MDLPKLRIRDTYFLKPKYKEGSFKGGMPPKGYFEVRRSEGS
jgi:hypothetical protein